MSQKIKKILTKNIGALQHGRTIEKNKVKLSLRRRCSLTLVKQQG